MTNKLSWNPPKWKSYDFDGTNFSVELENGKIFKGYSENTFIKLKNHRDSCIEIFGTILGNDEHLSELSELSKVLDLNLSMGHWPECSDIREFIKRYYERVAKIGNSNKFKIYIETEFDITPKFTI